MKQCQAETLASTYSAPHRCLKRIGLSVRSGMLLCAHHDAMAARKRDRSRIA